MSYVIGFIVTFNVMIVLGLRNLKGAAHKNDK